MLRDDSMVTTPVRCVFASLVVLVAGARGRLGRLVTLFVAVAIASGCGAEFELPEVSPLANASIELSKGPCYGSCSEYRVVVHADGGVEWTGIRYVTQEGWRRDLVTRDEVARLFQELDVLGFDHWFAPLRLTPYPPIRKADGTLHVNHYERIDAPQTTLTVEKHQVRKSLTYYTLDVGPELRNFEAKLLALGRLGLWSAYSR